METQSNIFDFIRPASKIRRKSHRRSRSRQNSSDTVTNPSGTNPSSTLINLIVPAERLLNNLHHLRQQLMAPNVLNNVSTDTLGYRLRQINRRIDKINRQVTTLLNQNLSEITLNSSELAENAREIRKDVILEVFMPYVLALDTMLSLQQFPN